MYQVVYVPYAEEETECAEGEINVPIIGCQNKYAVAAGLVATGAVIGLVFLRR